MQSTKKYLFLDQGTVNWHWTTGVRNRLRPLQKDAESGALFTEDYFSTPSRPWEVRYDNSYPNVIFDPRDGLYRLYYTLFIKDDDSSSHALSDRPGKLYRPTSQRITGLCYAESKDGVTWVKPDLGLVEHNGSTDNNIILTRAHGAGVFLDEADPDPAKRYKLVTKIDFGNANHFMAVCYSADGVNFSDPIPWPRFNPQADTHNVVFRDPATGYFVLITRIWRDGLRIAVRSESVDFITWSEPVEILRGRGPQWQVYSMPVFYDAGLYIGLPSMYREGDRSMPDFDTVDVSLAYSRDLQMFDFVADGEPFLQRGQGSYPDGDFDSGCIFAAAPIEIDGRLWFYYMGGNGQHTNFRETSFARASMERDKYAFFEAVDPATAGSLVTSPFSVYGENVRLLAEVEVGGRIAYEVCSPSTLEAYEGFGKDDCVAITESGWQQLRFGKAYSELPNVPVCFRLHIDGESRVFGLDGSLWLKQK